MSKIILKGFIEVPDEDLDQVLEELPNHVRLTKAEPGCLVFEVLRDLQNRNRFNVYEEFSSQHAFDLHQERVKASRWGAVTGNVSRNYDIREVIEE